MLNISYIGWKLWIFTNSVLLSHSFFIAHTLLWHSKRNVASFLKRRRALGKKIKSLPLYFVLILCCHLPTALIARYLRLRRARRNFTSTNKACLNLTLVPHYMCSYTEISLHKTWIGLTRYIFLKFWLCMQKIIPVALCSNILKKNGKIAKGYTVDFQPQNGLLRLCWYKTLNILVVLYMKLT